MILHVYITITHNYPSSIHNNPSYNIHLWFLTSNRTHIYRLWMECGVFIYIYVYYTFYSGYPSLMAYYPSLITIFNGYKSTRNGHFQKLCLFTRGYLSSMPNITTMSCDRVQMLLDSSWPLAPAHAPPRAPVDPHNGVFNGGVKGPGITARAARDSTVRNQWKCQATFLPRVITW